MHNRNNISAPVTMTVVSLPGTVGSSISGAVAGTGHASQASSKSAHELNSAHADSLLKALNVLVDESGNAHEEKSPGLNLFPDALQDILEMVRSGVDSTAAGLLLAPTMTISHLAQLPLDVKVSFQALSKSIAETRPFFQTRQASILDIDKELQENQTFLSANCKALCNNICDITEHLKQEVDKNYDQKLSAAKSHAHLVKSFASLSMLTSLGAAGVVSLMFDVIGSSFREVSGLTEFSKQESSHPQEKNIYQAFSACCQSFSKSQDCRESLMALRHLEAAILDFKPASDMGENHSLTGPSLSVFTRMLTAEPFVKTLSSFNTSALALTEAHVALTHERDRFYEDTRRSATLASCLNQCLGGDNHSQNVTQFCRAFDEAIGHIDGDLHNIENNQSIAGSAKSTVRSSAAVVMVPSLITGLTGMISREFSGSVDFTKHDRGSKQESKVVSQSRPEMTGADLDQLMSRICALQERIQRCGELGVSAPVVLGVSQAATTGPLISSLNVLAGMYSALREFKTMSQSPSQATELNEAERLKAVQYAQSVVNSNQKSAGSTGAGSTSENLSLHRQIESVMQKLVLIHRSKMNFLKPDMQRNDLDSAGKSSIAFTQGNSTGFLLGSLGVLALISLQSGIGTEALFAVSQFVTQAKRVSEGVDRTELDNGSKSNMSFASNATRLSEDSIKDSTLSQTVSKTTYLMLESTFSRSLTVSLCQSGALKEMLRRLVRQEQEKLVHAPGFLDCAVVSDAIKPLLRNNILQVLDEAEANHNPIPGLNRDMASSLASMSNASIATALCEHSIFVTPILKSIVAMKRASVIPENMKNEGVSANSELSRVISTSLNQVQGFTANFMEEVLEINNPMKNSSLAESSDSLQAGSMSVTSAVSLFCEELFEICISRSLTLLDKEKVALTSKETREHSQQQQQLSSKAMIEDSALDEKSRVSHVITALRLTLSHLGASLGEFATQMHTRPDVLKDNLQIHSSQASFIKSMSSGFSSCSQAMLAISAVLSQLPVSTVGSVESLREVIHSIDQHLILKPMHSSERSTRDCGSDSTLLTGVGTDCVSSLLCTVTKLLLRASVFGLDTTLSVAKILEILSLHPHPGDALSLELQEMSQPNGFSHNVTEVKQNLLVSTTMGAASVCATSKTGDSMSTENALRTLQAAVDQQIEKVALLEDHEENSKLGLKAFFEMIIRILAHDKSDDVNDYKDIVQRFDRGGIALSSYHSDYGSIVRISSDKIKNHLIIDDKFLSCDGAATLIDTFINKAYNKEHKPAESLLDKLKLEFNNINNLSEKSRNCWEYIVNEVMDRLMLESTRSSIFKPGESRLNKQKWKDRKNNLIRNINVEELEPAEISLGNNNNT